jgi:two-component system response regulator FixJ
LPPLIHIVDDDPKVRAAASHLLSSHGYSTEIYSDGAEFLAQASLDRGCILLDLSMPGMNGHEVQEELSRRGVGLPVVVMSGHGDLPGAVSAMKLGAVDFLQKPLHEKELLAALDRALDAFSRGEERRKARSEAVARLQRLSPRETQILQGLLAGLSNKAIARLLGLSPRTVEMHRANMMSDLGISSVPDAVRIAIDAELPPLTEASELPAPETKNRGAPAADAGGAAGLAGQLDEPLTAISNFARGIRDRIDQSPLREDPAIREAIIGVEKSAALAAEIAERIRQHALEER